MKDIAMGIAGGIGLLIFAGLLFRYKDASIGLLNASFSGGNNTIKTLQMR